MVELVFLACLGGSFADCRQHSLVYAGLTPRECMIQAPSNLLKWREAHPEYRILRWNCRALDGGQDL